VLVARKIDACNTCHKIKSFCVVATGFWLPAIRSWDSYEPRAASYQPLSALTLLVFRILANHPHHPAAVDDLALVTDFLHRCSYLHKPSFQLSALSLQQKSYL
jgi:hypothetical protein